MKKYLLPGLLSLLLSACGASMEHQMSQSADNAYGALQSPSVSSAEPPPAPPGFADDGEYLLAEQAASSKMMSKHDSGSAGNEEAQYVGGSTKKFGGENQMQEPPIAKQNGKSPRPDGPLVVYNGYLHLRVKRLLDALDEISRITRENNGYVDSLTERTIVVRIPGEQFDELIDRFSKLGDLLSREISAIEVTAQYTDLTARLAVAEETRDRLLALLEKVRDARERLRILEEIKRLSEQIETYKSTLATLQNLLKYFTVSIDLTPILEDDASVQHQSPFEWVRNLSPHRTSIWGGARQIQMQLPADFVLFEKEKDYRAQAADTTIIRGGVVANNPKGDSRFWADSIIYEMKGRSESLELQGAAKKLKWQLFKNADLLPRWYLVGVSVVEDDVYVVEVFFPNEAAFNRHKDAILKALETFEVNR